MDLRDFLEVLIRRWKMAHPNAEIDDMDDILNILGGNASTWATAHDEDYDIATAISQDLATISEMGHAQEICDEADPDDYSLREFLLMFAPGSLD